jgi:hypothetical protein
MITRSILEGDSSEIIAFKLILVTTEPSCLIFARFFLSIQMLKKIVKLHFFTFKNKNFLVSTIMNIIFDEVYLHCGVQFGALLEEVNHSL